MDLLKDLKPFKKELDAFLNERIFPHHNTLGKLAPIWNKYKKINKKTNAGTSETNLGCAGCVRDMMKGLTAWRRILTDDPTVHFKGVPQKKSAPKIEKIDIIDYSKMKWPELKSHAKEKGMKMTQKTKKTEVIKWLENL